MKKGSYLVNTARGKIVDRDALVAAVSSGHIEGYAGKAEDQSSFWFS